MLVLSVLCAPYLVQASRSGAVPKVTRLKDLDRSAREAGLCAFVFRTRSQVDLFCGL
jgi:hypothetical protein